MVQPTNKLESTDINTKRQQLQLHRSSMQATISVLCQRA